MQSYIKRSLPPINAISISMLLVWTLVFFEAYIILIEERRAPTYFYAEAVENATAVQRGGPLIMSVKLARHRACFVLVSRYFTDSENERVDLPPTLLQVQKVGYEEYTRRFDIPSYVALGPARVWVTSSYQCHWSHAFWPLVISRSYDFKITE